MTRLIGFLLGFVLPIEITLVGLRRLTDHMPTVVLATLALALFLTALVVAKPKPTPRQWVAQIQDPCATMQLTVSITGLAASAF